MICYKCNSEIPEGYSYCPNCGYNMNSQDSNTQTGPNTTFNANQTAMFQNMYQQKQTEQDDTVSIGMWLGVFLINVIPCIGWLIYIIMMFVWAFGNNTKKSLKNFAKAQLIIMLVVIAIAVVFVIFASLTNWHIFSGHKLFDEFNRSNGIQPFNGGNGFYYKIN